MQKTAQPKHEIISAINSFNEGKLKEMGYSKEEWYGLPSEVYAKGDILIIPAKRFYQGFSPEECEAHEELAKDAPDNLVYLDVKNPFTTPINNILAKASLEAALFPKNPGYPAVEYRGLFGIKAKNEDSDVNILEQLWYNVNSVLLTEEFGMKYLDNRYSRFFDNKIFSFVKTEKSVPDVEVVDVATRNFRNYLERLKNYLNKEEVRGGIKNGSSMIWGFYSPKQELEFIDMISGIEIMPSKELLENLAKHKDIADDLFR